jgi:predicted Zn-dependent protease
MREAFIAAFEAACAVLRGSEVLLGQFAGEASDFVRFNRGRVRQPMSVRQGYLTLRLIDGRRHDSVTLAVTGQTATDRADAAAAVAGLRAELASLPEDPYLAFNSEPLTSESIRTGTLPSPAQAIDTITAAANGNDLVGILASGPIYRGFASSFGSRHWHAVDSSLFDWSIFHAGDKAVKSAWASATWDDVALAHKIAESLEQLPYLARPAHTIAPGSYRAFLSHAALDELTSMLNWGGLSVRSQRTRQSTIQKLVDGEAHLSPMLHLREHIAAGLAPAFNAMGFVRPPEVELIRDGRHAGAMIGVRSAREYELQSNGADDGESTEAIDMAGGGLAEGDALAALDTGVWVGNFHYLNWSDRSAARITGLTRFATYWVENGRIVAPLSVMRFDDSLFRMLGTELEALTTQTEWMLNNATYGGRSVQTSRVPGALLRELRLTL